METRPIYKTAEELGIEQWERDGLVALVEPLSRNKLNLRMHYANAQEIECGTVACIGGWLKYFAKPRAYYLHKSGAFDLFYPGNVLNALPFVEPSGGQAARAIVNFLVTGDPQWDRVMAEAS